MPFAILVLQMLCDAFQFYSPPSHTQCFGGFGNVIIFNEFSSPDHVLLSI